MSTGKNSRKRGPGANKLRIIGGRWRGRKLGFPDLPGLRPTGDRLRETLFNWLSPVIVDARCLDLFAGSGALGLEAVSRGAASATLVERSNEACQSLRQHRQTLAAGDAIEIVQADALQWLQQTPPRPFDIVFLDPPFDSPLLEASTTLLAAPGWLASGARIYMESAKAQMPPDPANWELLRSVESGQVLCRLFRFGGS